MKTELTNFTRKLESIYNGEPWHGESLFQKLESIGPKEAFAVPMPAGHCIAQVVAHITAWRRVLSERLKGNMDYQVDDDMDWLSIPALQQKGWETILTELAESQRELLVLLSAGTDELLDRAYSGTRTYRSFIEGIIQHDIYHTGQVGLLAAAIKNQA